MSTSLLLPPTHIPTPMKNSPSDRPPINPLGPLRPNISCPRSTSVKFPSFPQFSSRTAPKPSSPTPSLTPSPTSPFSSLFDGSLSPSSPSSCRASSTSLNMKKSQSTLIIPNLLDFFKPSSGSKSGMKRDTSSRSLSSSSYSTKKGIPLIRKCHTVISLSSSAAASPAPPAPLLKVIPNERKSQGRMGILRRITSSKSATLNSSSKNSFSGLQSGVRHHRTSPRTPSSTSLWTHEEDVNHPSNQTLYPQHEQEFIENSSFIDTRLSDRLNFSNVDNGEPCTRAHSRSASVVSRGSRRLSSLSNCCSDSVFCRLCYSDVSIHNMWQLSQCQCRFCANCMSEYCSFRIRQGDPLIECPDANCDCAGELTSEEVRLLVTPELHRLYIKCGREREVNIDPLRIWCPTPGCETVVTLMASKHSGKPTRTICSACTEAFCSSCSTKWHKGLPCFNGQQGKEVPLSASIKRCPRCKILIERDEGCAQMQCRKCKHVFCWYCLESLEDDFLLRHYDKGPCKDKLGHSRASVLWHRAQVVLIFCGFGVMLLVVSPLLIMIGPCMLCRASRSCRNNQEETEDDIEDAL